METFGVWDAQSVSTRVYTCVCVQRACPEMALRWGR